MDNITIMAGAIFRTGSILMSTMPVIFVTLFAADLLVRMGLLNRLMLLINPVMRRTGLPAEVSAAFLASFGSQLSGTVILQKLRREGVISRSELILVLQINSLPHYIRELFTYFAPVVIPVLGLVPGTIHAVSFCFTGIFKLMLIIIAVKIILRKRGPAHEDDSLPENVKGREKLTSRLLLDSLGKSSRNFLRMSVVLILMTFLVALAEGYGVFIWLQSAVGPLISLLHIPDKMLVPAMTYLGNSVAANYMVGALYKSGAVTWQVAAVTVLTGSIMAIPVVTVKRSLARNISVLGTVEGLLNTAVTLCIGVAGRIIFLVGFLIIAVL